LLDAVGQIGRFEASERLHHEAGVQADEERDVRDGFVGFERASERL
jgi:hypothetical protein